MCLSEARFLPDSNRRCLESCESLHVISACGVFKNFLSPEPNSFHIHYFWSRLSISLLLLSSVKMLPPFLYSTYKQYKWDNNYLANWLAQTARSCGSPLVPSTNFSAPSKKKGKNNRKPKPSTTLQPPPKQAIVLKLYVPLAQHIVQHQPSVIIPTSLLSTIKRAIKARQEISKSYTEEDARSSHSGHAHFVSVLEQVLDVLKSRFPTPPPARDPSNKSTREDDFATTFSALKVEQPRDQQTASKSPATEPAVEEPVKLEEFEAEPVHDALKDQFVVACLMNDVARILDYVRDVWQRYADGEIDLITASVAANTAVQIVTRLEQDFESETTQVRGGAQAIVWEYAYQCFASGLVDSVLGVVEKSTKPTTVFVSDEVAHTTLFAMYNCLKAITSTFSLHDPPIYPPKTSAEVDESKPRICKSAAEKIQDDSVALEEVFPLVHYAILTFRERTIPLDDEFLIQLAKYLLGEEKFSLTLVFAAQAFIEALYAVVDKTNTALEYLLRLGRRLKDSAEKTRSHDRGISTKWTINTIDSRVLNDPIYALAERLVSEHGGCTPEPFALLKKHPLLCGLLSFDVLMEPQADQLANLVNPCGAILICAHLVNAIEQEGHLGTPWYEMDLAIGYQTPEHMFFGSLPTSFGQYRNRLALALGCSTALFSRDMRKSGPIMSKRTARSLECRTPVFKLLNQFHYQDAGIDLAQVEVYLNRVFESDDTATDSTNTASFGVREKAIPKAGRKSLRDLNTSMLKPEELLLAIEYAMEQEISILHFDWLLLHRQCWTLLQRLEAKIGDMIAAVFGKDWKGKENNISKLGAFILLDAADQAKAAEQMQKQYPGRKQINRMFEMAGEVAEEFLRELEREREEAWEKETDGTKM